jgi:hypothetical protein
VLIPINYLHAVYHMQHDHWENGEFRDTQIIHESLMTREAHGISHVMPHEKLQQGPLSSSLQACHFPPPYSLSLGSTQPCDSSGSSFWLSWVALGHSITHSLTSITGRELLKPCPQIAHIYNKGTKGEGKEHIDWGS